jgi:hypothetical protein
VGAKDKPENRAGGDHKGPSEQNLKIIGACSQLTKE